MPFSGQALGTVFGLPMTGFISSSALGWPGIFRFYGILSGIIGVLLFWLAADTPAKHPKISEAERKYVEEELGKGDEAKVYLVINCYPDNVFQYIIMKLLVITAAGRYHFT